MGVFSNLFSMTKESQDSNSTIDLNEHTIENGNEVDRILQKSMRAEESKALIENPLAIVNNIGYKSKPSSLTYDTLKAMATRNSVVSSIITTRVNQVSTFTKPARYTRDGVGYQITLRDPKKDPTKEQEELILAIEQFIENCGFSYNPYRDDFNTLMKKIVRDSLTYDQMAIEIVPDAVGRPAEIYAIDASTIRAASTLTDGVADNVTATNTIEDFNSTRWVQVINGTIQAEFTGLELAFGVRNPRTDINIQPYGLSELEMLIHQITSHLYAEEYNSRYFSQGGTTKGILNIKGHNISRNQLDSFRRQWTAQVQGLTGAWKTPVVAVDGLEYVNVSQSNREMEYENWMNYLINIVSAVYQIDPAEINFPNRGGSGGTSGGLGEGGVEGRLKNSKDKGLRPLLRYLEDYINKFIVHRFTPLLQFSFVGIDPETENDRIALEEKQARVYKTVNEIRKRHGLEEIKGGDIILDGTFANWMIQLNQKEDMEKQDMLPNQEGQTMEGDNQEGVDWKKVNEGEEQDAQISDAIDNV